jgi:hypothetical protein
MADNLAAYAPGGAPALQANQPEELSPKRLRPYRVVVHGLQHFCQKLPALVGNESWDVRDRSQHSPRQMVALLRDLRACDLAFCWAGRTDMGRFLWAARLLGVRKLILFWCGSDVLRAKQISSAKKVNAWIAKQIHWAASPILAEEVRSVGLKCEFVQASFVERVERPKPLPKEFSVLVYLPAADLASLYGWDRVVEVAKGLPEVRFTLAGLRQGKLMEVPQNVTVCGWTSDMARLYEESTLLWRPVRHDAGISFMALEALARGRHVLYTYPLAGAMQASDAPEARAAIEHLKALHDASALRLNRAGMDAIARTYSRAVVREELRRRWQQIICS